MISICVCCHRAELKVCAWKLNRQHDYMNSAITFAYRGSRQSTGNALWRTFAYFGTSKLAILRMYVTHVRCAAPLWPLAVLVATGVSE